MSIEFLKLDDELLVNENKFINEEFFSVAGVDEVGRGPLAGPVVAAAVIFSDLKRIPKVFDSKKLTEKQRNELDLQLRQNESVKFAIAEVSPEIIDKINILQATHLAMNEALKKLATTTKIDFVLVDGRPVKSITYPNLAIVKGDMKSASIAAASILAKVYRDNLMDKYAEEYPNYDFKSNKGYGTKKHLDAIFSCGITPIHRKSFSPIKEILSPFKQEEFDF